MFYESSRETSCFVFAFPKDTPDSMVAMLFYIFLFCFWCLASLLLAFGYSGLVLTERGGGRGLWFYSVAALVFINSGCCYE